MRITQSHKRRPWGTEGEARSPIEDVRLMLGFEIEREGWGLEGSRLRVRVLREREAVRVRLTRSRRCGRKLSGTEGEALEVQSKTWGWWGSKSKEKGEDLRSRVRVLREKAREKRFKRMRNEIQFKRLWGSGLACVLLGHLDCESALGPFQSP